MKWTFEWIGGATWILRAAGVSLACDPVLCAAGTLHDYRVFKSRRLNAPVSAPGQFDAVDIWLVTHGHQDHLDDPGLAQMRPGCRVITHANARSRLARQPFRSLRTLRWGQTAVEKVGHTTVTVEAVPAVHGVKPLVARLAGGVNGYWVDIDDHKSRLAVYVTGDTVTHPKVLRALEGRRPDVLIANMGAAQQGSWMGALTLSSGMLRELMDRLDPGVCLPVHHGTFSHYRESIMAVAQWHDPAVVILAPGQSYCSGGEPAAEG